MTVHIAIIDSGINPWHSHVKGVEGGVAFYQDPSGKVLVQDDFMDGIGHGTAIAGIIRKKAPRAVLHAVKIFHEALHAPAALLLSGLEWAVREHVKIIHLSLGTVKEEFRDPLEEICRRAYDEGVMIVAAARGSDDRIFPAAFETVTGVYWNRECDEGSLVHHPGCPVEFGAYGRPRPIPGLPQERNFCGDSFAAAHVTGMAARLLEKTPGAGTRWLKETLAKTANKGI